MSQLRIRNLVMVAVVLFGALSCSTGPKIKEFADTASSADEVQRLGADLQTAAEHQVNILSPASYQEARDALADAKKDQEKKRDAKDILHRVAEGRAYLDQANQSAEVARGKMEEVAIARMEAITAGAPKYYPDDFKKADENLRDVTSRIEKNDFGSVADNRGKLQKEYRDVELKAIKYTTLAPARAMIVQAKKEGAEDGAKQTLALAEKKVNDTEAFIIANRHETEAIKLRSEDAKNEADHLLKITRAAKTAKNITPEEVALRIEKEQNKALDGQTQLAQERALVGTMENETRDLKSAQAFDRSFEAARAEFSVSEAEVYRQGNRLVIRLRGLEFPVNQSVVRGSNFPLLAKVAKVIKDFENSSVTVEGHTDSDGSKMKNHKLSTERAQAIAEYLISNSAVERQNITAVGYGFDQPLASNKTAKGKAENRRVDILIDSKKAAE